MIAAGPAKYRDSMGFYTMQAVYCDDENRV